MDSAGQVVLVAAVVLCALAFAALAVTLVRVRDGLASLRDELRVVAESNTETRALLAEARDDLDRFDRVIGSAEAISGIVGRTSKSRVAKTALSTPAIKAAGIATGTSRAVRKLRTGT